MKNKKKIILIPIIIAVVIIALVLYYKNKENNIVFLLNGDEQMTIEYGSSFVDPGFIAKDGYGNDINKNVIVKGNVNTFVTGIYKIDYELNFNDNKLNLIRIVTVKEIKPEDLEIKLNGDDNIYLLKGASYEESGAYVNNKINNSIFELGNLTISNNVDTTKSGVYEVLYTFTYKGGVISATRKVIVIDIQHKITPEELTSDKVRILLELDNIDNYLKTILPNGSTTTDKNIEYEISSNGKYTFKIVLSNNQEFTKEIRVDNIIKKYTCIGEITSTGTKIVVSPTTDIKEYEWNTNNEIIKGTSVYTNNKIVSEAKVNLIFEDERKYQLNCSITDKLLYHFKYDENNTKPYMKCDTYTADDKIRLDALLKQVIEEAGYGTRAGVVAAARFLVGGLDYKVKYLGPKQVNSALGKYQRIGLNIGQSGAWGCSVSGWTQGMDCTNFVSWAFYQNGITTHPYSTYHSNVREVIDKIKVGDLLYTPCTSSECKNAYKLNHVGIIIGIDDNNIYVAESTTGNINAIVVTKLDKNNMPASGKFSIVHFFEYKSEGNVTNMWMS